MICGETLGGIDASGTAAAVGDDTSGGEVEAIAGAEEFHSEQSRCERGFSGTREDGNKPECGKKIDGNAESMGERVAKGGTDEKQRGDFAAFEACAEGDDGEDEFCEPRASRNIAGGEEGGQGDGSGAIGQHAEAEVVGATNEEKQTDDQESAHDRTEFGAGDVGLEGGAETVGDDGEKRTDATENDGGENDFSHQPEIERSSGGRNVDVVMGVADAPRAASPVGKNGREKAGNKRVVLDPANDEHFERKNRAGDGRAKDGAKSCGDTRHQQDSDGLCI